MSSGIWARGESSKHRIRKYVYKEQGRDFCQSREKPKSNVLHVVTPSAIPASCALLRVFAAEAFAMLGEVGINLRIGNDRTLGWCPAPLTHVLLCELPFFKWRATVRTRNAPPKPVLETAGTSGAAPGPIVQASPLPPRCRRQRSAAAERTRGCGWRCRVAPAVAHACDGFASRLAKGVERLWAERAVDETDRTRQFKPS